MIVGETRRLDGDVTTLAGAGLFSISNIEDMLGYGRGRIDQGYYVLLLKRKLSEDDFQFGGTTLRSGGREGPPGATKFADEQRWRIHHRILQEKGREGYRALQKWALGNTSLSGETRIAKVLPVIRHDKTLPPNVQYPMGGGGLQWKLTRALEFHVAAQIDASGEAVWPGGSAMVGLHAPDARMVDARTRLRRYLAEVAFSER